MIKGAVIAVICLAIGTFSGYRLAAMQEGTILYMYNLGKTIKK